jgi:hypothetical protein
VIILYRMHVIVSQYQNHRPDAKWQSGVTDIPYLYGHGWDRPLVSELQVQTFLHVHVLTFRPFRRN